MISHNAAGKQFLQELEHLHHHFPIVTDKALIDLVNGMSVNRDVLKYRKRQNFWERLLDKISGKTYRGQLLLDENVSTGQVSLTNFLFEFVDSLRVSQLALHITQQSLLETRQAVRTQKQESRILQQQFQEYIGYFEGKCMEYETRIHALEIRVAAYEEFERLIASWNVGQAYSEAPWLLQVMFLARELFSGVILTYEQETHDTTTYREKLVNTILASSAFDPNAPIGFAEALEKLLIQIPMANRELLSTLTEVRSLPEFRLLLMPHVFTISTALELANTPESARPHEIGQCALALCHNYIGKLSRTTSIHTIVTKLVEEIANDSLIVIERH